jgi:PAS domain S-box-containing protein
MRGKRAKEGVRHDDPDTLEAGEPAGRLHELQLYELALEAGEMGAWEWDPLTGVSTWNDRMLELLGHLPGEVEAESATFFDRLHPEDRAGVQRALDECLEHGTRFDTEMRIELPGGRMRWLAAIGRRMADPHTGRTHVLGIVFDITDRRLREEQLEAHVENRSRLAERRAEQLRRLALELNRIEQRERQRLARILHDDLQQLLVAAKLRLGHLRATCDGPEAEVVAKVRELIVQGIDTSRSLATELQPPVLHQAGLVEALRWLARRTRDVHGLSVDLGVEGEVQDLPDQVRVTLFETTRELLFNVRKHAGVESASVDLIFDGRAVRVRVSDEGRGLDPEEVLSLDRDDAGGFGLLNLRERLEALGGNLRVDGVPGEGTRMEASLPFEVVARVEEDDDEMRPLSHPEASLLRDGGGEELRVLVVDDHDMVREGLVSILDAHHVLTVAGEAADGREAVSKADELEPDVVIMDVDMPVLNGIEATRRIRERHPDMTVVGVSLHTETELEQAMRTAGAAGYVHKDDPSQDLVQAVITACSEARRRTDR